MFVKNRSHFQKPLFSTVTTLPEKQRKRLEASWAGTFYVDVFCRIEEKTFEILYSGEWCVVDDGEVVKGADIYDAPLSARLAAAASFNAPAGIPALSAGKPPRLAKSASVPSLKAAKSPCQRSFAIFM